MGGTKCKTDRPFSDARVFHKAGKTREGYWTNDDILSQAQKAIEIFQHRWPAEQALFLYDNATIHKKRAPGGLSAMMMPKYPKAQWPKGDAPQMHDGRHPNGTAQSLYYPDDHPQYPGYFKGMEQILRERLLISDGQTLKASCGTSLNKCPPGITYCCCRRMLYSQPDFMEQKSALEELIEGAGHLILFYPKFHCELNFIEQYWGNAKFRYQKTALTNNDDEMMENMKACLDVVPVELI